MAVINRAIDTDAKRRAFTLKESIFRNTSYILVNISNWVLNSTRWWITEWYISFALKTDHNQNLQYDWNKPMFKKGLIKDNNSMKGEDKDRMTKKYLVLIRQYKIDPLSKTI